MIFAALSFLELIILSLLMKYVENWTINNFTISMIRSFWLPYIVTAIAGVFAACAVFVGGRNRKEIVSLAIASLVVGILIAAFTILVIKMRIRISIIDGVTAVIWSDYCARPSMALAGVFIANGIRHFIGASKYKKQENNENKENKEKQEKAEETEEQQIADE